MRRPRLPMVSRQKRTPSQQRRLRSSWSGGAERLRHSCSPRLPVAYGRVHEELRISYRYARPSLRSKAPTFRYPLDIISGEDRAGSLLPLTENK
jgi:hypothetical protein